ncbi:MAG: tRNA pseudouridine(55) synthase TruB [Saprospiraceae bacterium]|nr:tRNA pseudouridine(55) synthase TruB [Saprospiraceae bacterium]
MLRKDSDFPEPFPKGFIILLNKPFSWSSFDVVNKVRYMLAKKLQLKAKKVKVGHAGTLDPLATGLLILCVGDYTKRIESLQVMPKCYTGVITFGATTASYDLEKEPDTFFPTDHITNELIQQTLPDFIGDIQQVPPVFSAIKIDGERIYKNARTGETVEIPFRQVRIDSFEVGELHPVSGKQDRQTDFAGKKSKIIMLHPDYEQGMQIDFEVRCGKGTYIRSLANDLGQALGSGAYLSSLTRTETGGFKLEDAWEIEELESWFERSSK